MTNSTIDTMNTYNIAKETPVPKPVESDYSYPAEFHINLMVNLRCIQDFYIHN